MAGQSSKKMEVVNFTMAALNAFLGGKPKMNAVVLRAKSADFNFNPLHFVFDHGGDAVLDQIDLIH